MITCFIGTRAQLIKMAPILLEIERRKLSLNLVLTGQHKETMEQLMADFRIQWKPRYLYDGPEITGILQMAKWFIAGCIRALRFSDEFMPRPAGESNVVLVHGDTFSTLLGAVVGRMLGVDVAHIEAGLRSRNLFHPFPEELTRIIVFRLSRLSFCPGKWAMKNMMGYQSRAIDTCHNTLQDALRLMLSFPMDTVPPFDQEYGIASIHRFENIFNRGKLLEIVALIERAAECFPIAFVLHPATRKKLTHFGLLGRLENNARIRLVPRMGYARFVQLMRGARFVITDGGGNQEELSYLGIPTLLMRKATERQEGLGITATLCNFDKTVLETFLSSLSRLEKKGMPMESEEIPASRIIVDHLETYGVKQP